MANSSNQSSETLQRRSRQNALVLFILFLLQPVAVIILMAVRLAGSSAFNEIYLWVRSFGIFAGIYAVSFLPVRSRVIQRMPTFYLIAAFVGGGGLILFLVIQLIGLWGTL